MDWTPSHIEEMKATCLEEIKANQPLQLNGMEGVTVWINGTKFENVSENNISLPVQKEFTPEYLLEVEAVSCQNECSGNGNCIKGKIKAVLKRRLNTLKTIQYILSKPYNVR